MEQLNLLVNFLLHDMRRRKNEFSFLWESAPHGSKKPKTAEKLRLSFQENAKLQGFQSLRA